MDITTGLGLSSTACRWARGLPFTMRRLTQRKLVDEIATIAEIARKQGPLGLEKVEIEDPYLAKGICFVGYDYDAEFVRDNLERVCDNLKHDRDNLESDRDKADTDPLFPDDPNIAANRRLTITLIREAPRRCRRT